MADWMVIVGSFVDLCDRCYTNVLNDGCRGIS